MSRLSPGQETTIEVLDQAGHAQQEIAEMVGCSQPTVSQIVGSWEDNGLKFCFAGHYRAVKEHERGQPVYIHRLLACVDHTLDELKGKHVHHKNEFEWDNRLDNIELVTVSEHWDRHNRAKS